jgi:predicted phosphodiesterase
MNIHNFKLRLKQSERKHLFVTSDNHFDSRKCDRKRLKKDFDKALKLNAWIIINGDWLDVMGMKHDPRSIPNEIRPEYMESGSSYLDLVIHDSAKWLMPYRDNILIIGYGNHETNIVKRQQIDPLKWMIHLLNEGNDHKVELGAYQGACVFNFMRGKNNSSQNVKLYYHHGSGGGAKRSKGILNADILVAQNSWADIIISGHDHNKWYLPYTVMSLNHLASKWIERKVDILRLGSYKKKSRTFGWEIEKDFNEPTLGGWLIEFYWRDFFDEEKVRVRRIETKVSEM